MSWPATRSASRLRLRSIRRPASSTTRTTGKYVFKKSDKSEKTSEEMAAYWESWVRQYPIISIEDGLAEDDWTGWKILTEKVGRKIAARRRRSVRDQLEASAAGIEEGVANSILIKVNQIGTHQRDARRDRAGTPQRLHLDHFASLRRDRGHLHRRPRGRQRTLGRSRPARLRARTASRSTTSCCASKKSSVRRRSFSAAQSVNGGE